jgi:hypothetical protein
MQNMENADLIHLWKQQHSQIEKSITLNQKLLQEILTQKASKLLDGLKAIRWTGIIAGILWCLGIALVVISSWNISSVAFKLSLIINWVVTATAVGLYIHHLGLINKFDNSQTVVDAQLQLMRLKQSNLRTLGILWLQLPVFSTWFMTYEWLEGSPLTFWGIQVPIVLLQTYIGIWLFRNLHDKNVNKKWMKWFITKGEFARIHQASTFIQEIEDFKKETDGI